MKVHVVFGRDENIQYYNDYEADIDLETYVWGVCASEVAGSPLEAQKALACAARTNAIHKMNTDHCISDLSTKAQAFRSSRLTLKYAISKQAADETAGLVLYCGKKIAEPCAFSSCNGGKTRSAKDRWGSYRSFLIEQNDPYDTATNCNGHRVGISQLGASNRAKAGYDFKQILAFYYPTTYLHNINTGEDVEIERKDGDSDSKVKEVENMADVKASDLIKIYRQAADEHWPYVSDGSSYKSVDCSGLAVYAFRKLGGRIPYHGSNTMWRQDLNVSGRKNEIEIKPGYAVFVNKHDGKEPSRYANDGIGNMSHVGYYVGNGLVVEAKGTNSGTVYSNLSDSKWTHVGSFKGVIYDVQDGSQQKFVPFKGKVTTQSGDLNFRGTPNGAKIGTIPRDTVLQIAGESGDWYKTTYANKTGWVSKKYITKIDEYKKIYSIVIPGISEESIEDVKHVLNEAGLNFEIKEGTSA